MAGSTGITHRNCWWVITKAKVQGNKGRGQWEAVSWRLSQVSREAAPRKSHNRLRFT